MIVSFKHKGLRKLFEEGDRRRLPAEMIDRVLELLTAIHLANVVEQLDLPSYRLHPLRGDLKGHWAVTVRANWRIVFRFEDRNAFDVDFVDYH